MFNTNLVDAVKVQVISDMFDEDSFIEKGMKAWLTKISLVEIEEDGTLYQLFLDFEDFYEENKKYLTECFYPNKYTAKLPEKDLYTAEEAGMYSHKTSVYYWIANGEDLHVELSKHLNALGE